MPRTTTFLLAAIVLLFLAPMASSQDAAPPGTPTTTSENGKPTTTPSPEPTTPPAPEPAATPAVAPVAKSLTVADIITLSQAGLSEEVIVTKLKKSNQAFDLSPDQMLQLKTANVSDTVIQYMIDPAKPDPVPVATAAAPAADANFPEDPGVYWRRLGQKSWNELMPEVVNWKTGGVVKGFVTYGIIKPDVNGHLKGKTSKTTATTATELLIVLASGVSIAEYQLLRLHQNIDSREFRLATGGVFHQSGGAEHDQVEFQNVKVAPRRFIVYLTQLKEGEYGFLPPGAISSQNAAGSTGKIYTFKMLE